MLLTTKIFVEKIWNYETSRRCLCPISLKHGFVRNKQRATFNKQLIAAMQTKLILPFLLIFSWAHLGAQNDLPARLDALLHEAVTKDVFSGNVLIFKDNKPVFQKSVGMADYENSLLNTADTKFSIGSITKLFTKIMVLQLAAEGKISLDDKLGKHLSGFRPEVADRVTVAHLLHHQSGLGQYYEGPNFNPEETTVASATDFLPWIREEKLLFEPGAQAEYSNSGYVVLAAIIEKTEGKNYAEVLKIRVLDLSLIHI